MVSRKRPHYTATRRRATGRGASQGMSLPTKIGIGVAAAAVVVGGITLSVLHRDPCTSPDNCRVPVAAAIVYTAPDAQTTAYSLTSDIRDDLATYAKNGQSIQVARIEGDCTVSTTTIDMTPRNSKGETLQVPQDADKETAKRIEELQTALNTPTAGTNSRCLYVGLLSARIPNNIPVAIFSTGLDETAPVDFRDLGWETTPEQLTDVVTKGKAVPNLKGTTIAFHLAAPTGGQLSRTAESDYIKATWKALLTNAGAASVTFIDGAPGEAASTDQVPIIPPMPLPGTPITPQPDPVTPDKFSCTLQTVASFVPDEAILINEDEVKAALAGCVARITPGSTVVVEGHVAYLGGFDANGQPTDAGNVELAQKRADVIRQLLIDMGVVADSITTQGYGSDNLPDPSNPTSQANRICLITVTPPAN